MFCNRIKTAEAMYGRNAKKHHLACATHPEPLPPTMAIFWPGGTSNDRPLRMFGLSASYLNVTLSNTMLGELVIGTDRLGAPTIFCGQNQNHRICRSTCTSVCNYTGYQLRGVSASNAHIMSLPDNNRLRTSKLTLTSGSRRSKV